MSQGMSQTNRYRNQEMINFCRPYNLRVWHFSKGTAHVPFYNRKRQEPRHRKNRPKNRTGPNVGGGNAYPFENHRHARTARARRHTAARAGRGALPPAAATVARRSDAPPAPVVAAAAAAAVASSVRPSVVVVESRALRVRTSAMLRCMYDTVVKHGNGQHSERCMRAGGRGVRGGEGSKNENKKKY